MTDYTSMTKHAFEKSNVKTVGPFKVLSVTPSTVKVDKYVVHDTVSVDRLTLAPATPGPERRTKYMSSCDRGTDKTWK